MKRAAELDITRRAYEKQLEARAMIEYPRLEAASAEVHREDFLGRGPWSIIGCAGGCVLAPSVASIYLYMASVVGLLNNGQPSGMRCGFASTIPKPLRCASPGSRSADQTSPIGDTSSYFPETRA